MNDKLPTFSNEDSYKTKFPVRYKKMLINFLMTSEVLFEGFSSFSFSLFLAQTLTTMTGWKSGGIQGCGGLRKANLISKGKAGHYEKTSELRKPAREEHFLRKEEVGMKCDLS